MKTQIMLDLETLGNKPGSVIVAIGAVKFGSGEILDSFYERVDAESCVNLGLRMDVSTVLWWMNQNDAARKEITQPGGKLSEVLMRFSSWVNDLDAEVWGNGASFDNVLLSDAYDRAQLPRPWKYYNDRCYRTVKNLRPEVPMARGGTHHNALDDAKSQATHLMAMIQGNTGKLLLECIAEIERLNEAIRLTLEENCHLADGDNCTLLRLKRAYAQNDKVSDPRQ